MRPALFPGVLGLTVMAGLLGGASRENAVQAAVLELMALPLAALAIRAMARSGRWPSGAILLILAAAIPLLQLVPLPPAVWMAAPGHAPLAQALALLGLPPRWAPLSLHPAATLDCALALLPPAAVFLATPLLSPDERRIVAVAWIGLGAVGLVLGVAQLLEPAGGPAYLYPTTNLGSLVGLFANRNHEAGFLLALLPIAAALTLPPPARRSARTRRPARAVSPILAGLFAPVAVVALGVVRSRAGVGLAGPAIVGGLAVLARSGASRGRLLLAGLAAVAGVAAVGLFALGPILDRFGASMAEEARFAAWPTVIQAARSLMPLGAGVGAFERVFRAAEPLRLVGPTFFNHAHDEYLEIWLETGVFGPALVAAFAVWFALAAFRAWRRGGEPLARGASVGVGLILAQSTVDYPLRTETVACLFAFACGGLAAARRAGP
jgi:O-antigen ligase